MALLISRRGIRFKTVLDRETGNSRGFGFANVEDPKVADAVIEALNGKDFGGSALRVSARACDNNAGGNRRGAANAAGQPGGPQSREQGGSQRREE